MKRYYAKGEMIRFSHGEYSEYSTGSTYEVLYPIDLKEFEEKFLEIYPGNYVSVSKLMKYLEKNLPLRKIEVTELWLGSYEYKPLKFEDSGDSGK